MLVFQWTVAALWTETKESVYQQMKVLFPVSMFSAVWETSLQEMFLAKARKCYQTHFFV